LPPCLKNGGALAIFRAYSDSWFHSSQEASYQPRAGVGRVVALGFIGAAVIKPKAHFVITFGR